MGYLINLDWAQEEKGDVYGSIGGKMTKVVTIHRPS